MPQFDVATFSSQLFWLCSCFITLLLFSARVTLPRLNRVFSLRWGKIEGTLQEAKKLNQQAEELITSYESEISLAKKRAHEMVLGTARQASSDLSRKKSELAKQHKKHFRDVELVIANKKADAMGDVQRIAHDLAIDLIRILTHEALEKETFKSDLSSSVIKRIAHEF